MPSALRHRNLRSAAHVAVGVLVSLVLLVALTHATAQGRSGSASATESTAPPAGEAEQPASEPTPAAPATRRPNVIFLMTDDQAVDDMRVMHKLKRKLGKHGTTFKQAFSPYPLCCPARATLLTGQYAQNHHVEGNRGPFGGFRAFDDDSTLATWLKKAGYTTAILGKYLNMYPSKKDPTYIPPGWDNWRVPIKNVYNYRKWTLNVNGVQRKYSGEYETDFVGDEAVQLVNKFSHRKKPYFMWVGFLAPHSGSPLEHDDPRAKGGQLGSPAVSNRYRNVYKHVPLPHKASINERDVSDKPIYIRQRAKRSRSELAELHQQRLESLRSVDDAVARIVDAVKRHGDLKNTVFIFTSDNGHMTGEHRRVGKILGYEESAQVPLIVSGPGFNTGSVLQQKVSLADVAPTIARIARVEPGLVVDGVPLQEFAQHPKRPDTRSILFQAGPRSSKPERWYTAIRTKRYVYVDWLDNEHELYDLKSDPLQLRNLAGKPQYQALEYDLATTLDRLKDCSGASCLNTVPSTTAP